MESVPLSVVVAYIQLSQLDRVVDALRRSEVRGFGCASAQPPREGEKAGVPRREAGVTRLTQQVALGQS
jgi:hypothetical protein